MSETPNNAARELVTTRLVPRRIDSSLNIDLSATSPAPSMRLQALGESRTGDYTAVAHSERDGLAFAARGKATNGR
jgi:hypothetical protein